MTSQKKDAGQEGKFADSAAALMQRAVLSKALSSVKSVAVLPLLAPADFGVFRTFLVVVGYLGHLHFGGLSVLNVRYPAASATDDEEECHRLHVAVWQICAVGAIVGAFVAYGLMTAWGLPASVLVVVAFLAGSTLLANFVSFLGRASGQFRWIANVEMKGAVLDLVATVVATLAFGLPGLLVAALVSRPAVAWLGRRMQFPKDWSRVDKGYMRGVLRDGGMMWSAGVTADLATTSDIVLLAFFLGETQFVGFYALATIVTRNAEVISNAVAGVEVVAISAAVGKHGSVHDPAVTNRLEAGLARDTLLTTLVACLFVGGIALATPLFPEYAPALPIISALAPVATLRRWRKYPLHIMAVGGRLKLSNVLVGSSLALLAGSFYAVYVAFPEAPFAFVLAANGVALISGAVLLATGLPAGMRMRVGGRVVVSHLPLLVLAGAGGLDGKRGAVAGAITCALLTLVAYRIVYPEALRTLRRTFGASLPRWRKPR